MLDSNKDRVIDKEDRAFQELLVFCAINKISEKWYQPIHNWALIISQLDIFFPDRLKLGR
jgi:hypothetical protein